MSTLPPSFPGGRACALAQEARALRPPGGQGVARSAARTAEECSPAVRWLCAPALLQAAPLFIGRSSHPEGLFLILQPPESQGLSGTRPEEMTTWARAGLCGGHPSAGPGCQRGQGSGGASSGCVLPGPRTGVSLLALRNLRLLSSQAWERAAP